jgi:uncharacterized protein (TIGR03000 family)
MRNRVFLTGLAALLALAFVAETADAQWRGGRGRGGNSWSVGIGDGGIGISYGRGGYGGGWGGYGSGYGWGGYGGGWNRGWGGYGSGYGWGGSGISIGLGSPYYGSSYYGSSYYGSYPGSSYYYSSPSYAYGSGYYASPSYTYASPSYTYSAPAYSSGSVILNDDTMSGGAIQQAGFQNRSANQVALRVLVPDASANVWIEGEQMSIQGPERLFVSPALETGRNYTYTVRASWMENGREISRTKSLDVQAGGEYVVNFHEADNASGNRDSNLTPPPAPAPERRDDGYRNDTNRNDTLRNDNRDRMPSRPTEPGLLDPDRPQEFVVVSAAGDSLIVTDANGGNRQTFTVPASASIMLDGQTGSLSDLREGQHVRLSMRGEAGNRTITRIEVQSKRDNQ